MNARILTPLGRESIYGAVRTRVAVSRVAMNPIAKRARVYV
jgi:hypothetical protein